MADIDRGDSSCSAVPTSRAPLRRQRSDVLAKHSLAFGASISRSYCCLLTLKKQRYRCVSLSRRYVPPMLTWVSYLFRQSSPTTGDKLHPEDCYSREVGVRKRMQDLKACKGISRRRKMAQPLPPEPVTHFTQHPQATWLMSLVSVHSYCAWPPYGPLTINPPKRTSPENRRRRSPSQLGNFIAEKFQTSSADDRIVAYTTHLSGNL